MSLQRADSEELIRAHNPASWYEYPTMPQTPAQWNEHATQQKASGDIKSDTSVTLSEEEVLLRLVKSHHMQSLAAEHQVEFSKHAAMHGWLTQFPSTIHEPPHPKMQSLHGHLAKAQTSNSEGRTEGRNVLMHGTDTSVLGVQKSCAHKDSWHSHKSSFKMKPAAKNYVPASSYHQARAAHIEEEGGHMDALTIVKNELSTQGLPAQSPPSHHAILSADAQPANLLDSPLLSPKYPACSAARESSLGRGASTHAANLPKRSQHPRNILQHTRGKKQQSQSSNASSGQRSQTASSMESSSNRTIPKTEALEGFQNVPMLKPHAVSFQMNSSTQPASTPTAMTSSTFGSSATFGKLPFGKSGFGRVETKPQKDPVIASASGGNKFSSTAAQVDENCLPQTQSCTPQKNAFYFQVYGPSPYSTRPSLKEVRRPKNNVIPAARSPLAAAQLSAARLPLASAKSPASRSVLESTPLPEAILPQSYRLSAKAPAFIPQAAARTQLVLEGVGSTYVDAAKPSSIPETMGPAHGNEEFQKGIEECADMCSAFRLSSMMPTAGHGSGLYDSFACCPPEQSVSCVSTPLEQY